MIVSYRPAMSQLNALAVTARASTARSQARSTGLQVASTPPVGLGISSIPWATTSVPAKPTRAVSDFRLAQAEVS